MQRRPCARWSADRPAPTGPARHRPVPPAGSARTPRRSGRRQCARPGNRTGRSGARNRRAGGTVPRTRRRHRPASGRSSPRRTAAARRRCLQVRKSPRGVRAARPGRAAPAPVGRADCPPPPRCRRHRVALPDRQRSSRRLPHDTLNRYTGQACHTGDGHRTSLRAIHSSGHIPANRPTGPAPAPGPAPATVTAEVTPSGTAALRAGCRAAASRPPPAAPGRAARAPPSLSPAAHRPP